MSEYEVLKTPFANDPFALVWRAFQNLYPDKPFEAFYDPMIRPQENGEPVYGMTDFGDDGSVIVFVKPDLTIEQATEIFTHELAHVAVGLDHDHDDVWEEAFDRIFREYHRVATAIFGDYNDPTANDCK